MLGLPLLTFIPTGAPLRLYSAFNSRLFVELLNRFHGDVDTDDDILSPGHASTSFRLPSQQPPEGLQST